MPNSDQSTEFTAPTLAPMMPAVESPYCACAAAAASCACAVWSASVLFARVDEEFDFV